MSADYAAIRAALATTLEGVDEITKVTAYETGDPPTNQLPHATIFLTDITWPGIGEQIGELGNVQCLATWLVRVFLDVRTLGSEVSAQEAQETLAAAISGALEADPFLGGLVDPARLTRAYSEIGEDERGTRYYAAAFEIETAVIYT